VQQVDEDGQVWLKEITSGGHRRVEIYSPKALVKIDPSMPPTQAIRFALTAHVPPTQLCEICHGQPAPERHFVTVPLPKGFVRVCGDDFASIKAEIRKRVAQTVSDIFVEAKAGQLKKAR